jgi:hypothetical protein
MRLSPAAFEPQTFTASQMSIVGDSVRMSALQQCKTLDMNLGSRL